jgi:hypothetical protein
VNGLEVSFGETKGFIHLQDFETLNLSIADFSPEQEVFFNLFKFYLIYN